MEMIIKDDNPVDISLVFAVPTKKICSATCGRRDGLTRGY
jgi:hypothetical protein